MRLSPHYCLHNIQGTWYLLPFGQNIASHKRGIRLNSTGVSIWNLLQNNSEPQTLSSLLAEEFGLSGEEASALDSDTSQFLQELVELGILLPDASEPPVVSYFRIAGCTLAWHGPERLIHPNLADFSCTEQATDIDLFLYYQKPELPAGEVLLLQTEELLILESPDGFRLEYLANPGLWSCILSPTGRQASFYCRTTASFEQLREALFHGIRQAFLVHAQQKGLFAVHSASVLFQEKAWLFSAPSGTGKTTHARLWRQYMYTTIINGDFNVIGREDNQLLVYGTPWCGTSGDYSTQIIPLGGITFLKRAPRDYINRLSPEEKQLLILNRLLSPFWTKEQFSRNVSFSGTLANQIPVFELYCTEGITALHTIREAIERTQP